MNHCRDELNVGDCDEVARFVETVEAAHFHQLANDFVRHLVAPFVDKRHIHVVNEDGHSATGRRAVRAADAFFHVAFNGALTTRIKLESK